MRRAAKSKNDRAAKSAAWNVLPRYRNFAIARLENAKAGDPLDRPAF
jgi:hypothetical protein